MNIERIANALLDLGTAWILWLLLLLSVIALGVIAERALLLVWTREKRERLEPELRRLLVEGRIDEARRRLESSRSFEARIVLSGLDAEQAESAWERMSSESQLARLSMERSLVYLGTLGNNAPFVGLLGTVIGIVGAFHELGLAQGEVSSGLMAQIGEALVATALGLLVALPAVATYNLFQRVIVARLGWAEALGHDVLAYHRSYGRAESQTDEAR